MELNEAAFLTISEDSILHDSHLNNNSRVPHDQGFGKAFRFSSEIVVEIENILYIQEGLAINSYLPVSPIYAVSKESSMQSDHDSILLVLKKASKVFENFPYFKYANHLAVSFLSLLDFNVGEHSSHSSLTEVLPTVRMILNFISAFFFKLMPLSFCSLNTFVLFILQPQASSKIKILIVFGNNHVFLTDVFTCFH
jgi:hypothetical protein